jgi:hypothetical protein
MEFLIIIVPVVIALMIWGAIHSHKKEQERLAAMRGWAAERGLFFNEEKVRGFDDEYPGFDCLGSGRNRYAHNIMVGTLDGLEAKLFDYHYQTRSRDSKGRTRTRTHRFSAVLVHPGFAIRPITVRREGMFDKVKAAFGWDDINFESAEFSRRYYVACEDKRWAYDVIHGKIMDLLLKARKYTIEGDGQAMMIRMGESRFDLAGFERAFGVLAKILREIPEHAKERAEQGVS